MNPQTRNEPEPAVAVNEKAAIHPDGNSGIVNLPVYIYLHSVSRAEDRIPKP